MKFKILGFSLFALLLGFVTAQSFALTQEEVDKKIESLEYIEPTMANLARLYWRMGSYEPDDENALDIFIHLTDCKIYETYRVNDIDWTEITNAKKQTIEDQAKSYPTRFEIVQPLRLGDYDAETQMFDVIRDYQIRKTKLFSVFAADGSNITCTGVPMTRIGYPEAIVFKTSESFELTKFPVPKEVAVPYIEEKLIQYRRLPINKQTPSAVYGFRKAFIVMKMNVFRKSDEMFSTGAASGNLPMFHAELERIEIYEDINREKLMHAKNFKKLRTISNYESKLRKEYEEARQKAASGG